MSELPAVYRNAIPVGASMLVDRICVKCSSRGTPIVWTIIINGEHFTRCDNCNIAMKL